jgi:hypothetical protein
MAQATRRSSSGRAGLVLPMLVGLALTISYVGCGGSGPGSTQLGAPSGQPITLVLKNNCTEPLNVRMNMDGPWSSVGIVKCAAGQTCPVQQGTYALDLGSVGLNFFVGSESSTATKAEITYKTNILTYDISVITEASACPNSCTNNSCCQQHFNRSLKITPDAGCRCLHCDSVTCPDAFHFPTDGSKQTNCTMSTELTVEFCPASACSHPKWRDCNPSEQSVCRNLQDQPCTGDLTVCCPHPAFGGTHTCYSEVGTPYAHPPDPSSPCGMNTANYCYVQNQ